MPRPAVAAYSEAKDAAFGYKKTRHTARYYSQKLRRAGTFESLLAYDAYCIGNKVASHGRIAARDNHLVESGGGD